MQACQYLSGVQSGPMQHKRAMLTRRVGRRKQLREQRFGGQPPSCQQSRSFRGPCLLLSAGCRSDAPFGALICLFPCSSQMNKPQHRKPAFAAG